MIVEFFLGPIFALLAKGFEMIRLDKINLPGWLGDFMDLVANAMMFFPIDVWVIVIANVVLWISIQFAWAVFEWVYKKIPGIN